jgi:hypothetical protein
VVHTEDKRSDKDVEMSETTNKCDKKQRTEDGGPTISS